MKHRTKLAAMALSGCLLLSACSSKADKASDTETETTVTTITETSADDSPWSIDFFTDEFGRDEVDSPFLLAQFKGTYLKYSGEKSTIHTVVFQIFRNDTYDAVVIYLYERGTSLVKQYFEGVDMEYSISMLEENDNVIKTTGIMTGGSSYIVCSALTDQNKIISALKNNNTVTFSIADEKGTSYHFDVECNGFAELFDTVDWGV